ncbi:MAG: recombination mediator protein UvsY [Candidatus Woesearchaeota archaeon]
MNLEQYKALKAKVEEDLAIDESNAADKSLKFSSMYSKYLALYLQELRILKNLSLEKDKLYGDLYHKLKFKNDYQLDSSKEIDTYVRSDESFYKKSLDVQNQEIVVKYLEETLQNINNTGYRIKTYVDFLKLRMGLK